jgi:hypothetical protein
VYSPYYEAHIWVSQAARSWINRGRESVDFGQGGRQKIKKRKVS